MGCKKLTYHETLSPLKVVCSDLNVSGISCVGSYRYGFQGQEKDDEVKGNGNSVNYKYRMHDPRVGRFFAVDPLASKYPHNGPYNFSENRVIDCIELEGLEAFWIHGMGGSPDQYKSDPNYSYNANLFKDLYTNNTNSEMDASFAWDGSDGNEKLSGFKQLLTPKDRKKAAIKLVDHVLDYRNEHDVHDEEITLMGTSAGGLVSLQAAEMLGEKGYKVNIILINPSAVRDENSVEHPGYENSGVNDILIFYTEGDNASRLLPGAGHMHDQSTIPEQYETGMLESKSKWGFFGMGKHFMSNLNSSSINNAGVGRLDPVTSGNARGSQSIIGDPDYGTEVEGATGGSGLW